MSSSAHVLGNRLLMKNRVFERRICSKEGVFFVKKVYIDAFR